MTTSEDILLQVNHVRHKKSDGVLFLMSERIGWLMTSKDTFSVSYQYADIKMQKISPDGKPKIQLQVVLHDGGASTFHFNSPEGEHVQRRDRDAVRQQLHRLLPMFQSRINKELEQKEKLLRENPSLLQLYQDLVITRITSAQQFWEQHAAQFVNKSTVRQEVGVSGAFLADIRPQTDGSAGLKYNLNADIIASIFKTYPAVRRKHIANVPAKMTESEFWTRFFQSHYFHRDRTNLSSKDIFTDCAKQDEKEIEAEKAVNVLENPLLDLRHMSDRTLYAGYGDPSNDPASSIPASSQAAISSSSSSASTSASNHSVNSSMIRRFNQHSINVLKASLESRSGTASTSTPPAVNEEPPAVSKKARIAEKVSFTDLESTQTSASCPLKLTKPDRYLSGPTPNQPSADGDTADDAAHSHKQIDSFHSCLRQWRPLQSQPLDAQTAVTVLGDLSPGGALMKSSLKDIAATADLPDQVKTEMAGLYRSVSELLRHFWSCFPVNTPTLEEKVTLMHETLQKFQQCKVQKFQEDLYRQHGLGPDVTAHLNNMLSIANVKYNQWQNNRRSRR